MWFFHQAYDRFQDTNVNKPNRWWNVLIDYIYCVYRNWILYQLIFFTRWEHTPNGGKRSDSCCLETGKYACIERCSRICHGERFFGINTYSSKFHEKSYFRFFAWNWKEVLFTISCDVERRCRLQLCTPIGTIIIMLYFNSVLKCSQLAYKVHVDWNKSSLSLIGI